MKHTLLVCVFLFSALIVRAQDDPGDVPRKNQPSETNAWEQEEAEAEPEKKPFRFKNRMVELSLANVSVEVSNDLVTAKDIFKDTATINLDGLLNGFRLDFSAVVKPLSLNFNWQDKWGFGLDIGHVYTFGNVSLPGSLISLERTDKETFGAGAAVFADLLGVPVFFHVNDFKIKVRPAFYVPLAYTEPGVSYRRSSIVGPDGSRGERISIDYDMRIYTVIDMGMIDDGSVTITPYAILADNLGFDMSLGLEYPLFSWLDVGTDIVNLPVPFAGAKLNYYTRLHDSIYVDTSLIDIPGMVSSGDFSKDAYHYPDSFEAEYGFDSDGKVLYRPFTMLFYANYRPFDSYILSLIPSLGFSINKLYPRPGAVEGGLSARCDLGNIFITTLGINYNDRKWKNSLDFILNLRAFEMDFGVSFQSPDFVKSFQGAGAGVNVGIKLGW